MTFEPNDVGTIVVALGIVISDLEKIHLKSDDYLVVKFVELRERILKEASDGYSVKE